MKKILCAALVCMMLAAMFVVPTSAEQSNVDVNALKFTEQPTIDGVISEEEWGAPTVTVNANEAATKDDEEANALNTFIDFQDEEVFEGMSYNVWLRYDADRFYVAVKVHDVDGFAAPNQGKNIWDNDCVQLRIDPQGPNSIMTKIDPNYDYKTTAYDWAELLKSKGFGDAGTNAWLNAGKLINAGFALVHGTTPQAFDMTEPQHVMETTEFQASYVEIGDQVDDFTVETSYEIAIPWDVIGDSVMGEGYKAVEGDILGMSLVVLNSNGSGINAYLTWGSGICGSQGEGSARKTCGGSNAVTLSSETYAPKAGYAVATTDAEDEETDTEKADAPTTDAANDTDAADETEAAEKSSKKDATKYDSVQQENGNIGLIIGIIAAVVVVVAAVVVVILKKKKK